MEDPNNPNPNVPPPVPPAPAPAAPPSPPPVVPPAGPATERPAWLPEGFASPEEFRAAYDKMQGEKPPEPQDPEADTGVFATEFVKEAGLDMSVLAQQITDTGSLDVESMGKLEAVAAARNIPKSMVAKYVQGQAAVAREDLNDVYSLVGGQDNYKKMAEWMGAKMSDSDLATFNTIAASGDVQQIKFAVRSMYEQWKANVRTPATLMRGTSSSAVATDVFGSQEEQMKAQADPRYKNDPAYRDQVLAKIIRTNRSRIS